MIVQSPIPDFESRNSTTFSPINMCGRVQYLSNNPSESIHYKSKENMGMVVEDSSLKTDMYMRSAVLEQCNATNCTTNDIINNHETYVKDKGLRFPNQYGQQNVRKQSILNENRSSTSSPKNELPIVFDRSPLSSPRRNLSSPGPSRSPSPYSLSSIREPGNICSQNFQVAQEISKGNNPRELSRFCHKRVHCNFDGHNITSNGNYDRTGSDMGDRDQDAISIHSTVDSDKDTIRESRDNTNAQYDFKTKDNNLPHPHIPVTEYSIATQPNKSKSKSSKSDDSKKDMNSDERKISNNSKNESWIRIAHSFIDEFKLEKRVLDVRTVSDLMDVYTSLKNPVILPFATQRSFYDQWARLPSEEGINRTITRSNTTCSAKCLSLAQAIQEDQLKTTNAVNENTLTVPNPAEVTCKSLDSIIDHYNQMSFVSNPVFVNRTKTPPVSPIKRPKSKISPGHQSRTSWGKGNEQISGGDCREYTKEQSRIEKLSPVGVRKKNVTSSSNNKHNKNNEADAMTMKYPTANVKNDIHKENRPLTSDKKVSTLSLFSSDDEIIQNKPSKQRPPIETFKKSSISSTDDVASNDSDLKMDESTTNNKVSLRKGDIVSTPNCVVLSRLKTTERRGSAKDIVRDPYDVTTSTMMLNLPHESVNNKNDQSSDHHIAHSGDKRTAHQNVSLNNITGLTRRSKTKILFNQIGPRYDRRENTVMSSSLHKPNSLRQSLLVNEAIYGKDITEYKAPNDNTTIRKSPSRPGTTNVKCKQKQPELPTREYSMCERLEPTIDIPSQSARLSPGKSERQSAISLANVHFLDLTDLKTMLRRTNTPIPRL